MNLIGETKLIMPFASCLKLGFSIKYKIFLVSNLLSIKIEYN